MDQYQGIISDNQLYNQIFSVTDQTQHTTWQDNQDDEHEGNLVNQPDNRSVTNYLETKSKDGWNNFFGTEKDNNISNSNFYTDQFYGYKGNDNFNFDRIGGSSTIKDFGDKDTITLPSSWINLLSIQNDNGTPLIKVNGNTVVRVEGDRKDVVTNEEFTKAKTGKSKIIIFK